MDEVNLGRRGRDLEWGMNWTEGSYGGGGEEHL